MTGPLTRPTRDFCPLPLSFATVPRHCPKASIALLPTFSRLSTCRNSDSVTPKAKHATPFVAPPILKKPTQIYRPRLRRTFSVTSLQPQSHQQPPLPPPPHNRGALHSHDSPPRTFDNASAPPQLHLSPPRQPTIHISRTNLHVNILIVIITSSLIPVLGYEIIVSA